MNEIDPAITAVAEAQKEFVRALALRLAPWPGLAEDIRQQVFLEFIEKAERWDLTRDVRPLLAGMTRNVALRAWREHTRTLPDQLRDLAEHIRDLAGSAQPTSAHESEDLAALKKCLSKLPDKSRRLVELHYYLDISSVEIASQMTMQADAIRRALFRIREQLRRCIRGLLKGEVV
jgi:RNA polymerase sigma factor (sigma-70 family)